MAANLIDCETHHAISCNTVLAIVRMTTQSLKNYIRRDDVMEGASLLAGSYDRSIRSHGENVTELNYQL